MTNDIICFVYSKVLEVYYIFCIASHCRHESDTTMTADATFFLLQSASRETEAYCVSMAHSHAAVAMTHQRGYKTTQHAPVHTV